MEAGNLWICESFVNATEGHRFGDSEVYETFTGDSGELFRFLRREYGRCTGKVHVDTEDGTKAVGWVFESRLKYEDVDETYLREVWVTLHDAPDTVVRTPHYHELGSAA